MSKHKYLTAPVEQTTTPSGVKYIVANEAAERFSFYGMKAILMDFMMLSMVTAAGLPDHLSEAEASTWYHTFSSAIYFFPLLGAIFSDWLFGKYRMILYVSLLYCVGHGILSLMDFHTGFDQRTLLFLGMICIAIGAGGIKPCASSHVGDQFGRANAYLMPVVFGWFYFSINFGSTFAMMLTPWLREHPSFGNSWAFGVPGVVMAVATLVFWLGRNKYVHVPPAGSRFFKETFSRDGIQALSNLIPVYLMIAPFWALYDQTGSRWVAQAHSMNRDLFGWEPKPAHMQVTNALLVMLFIPLFSYVIYPFAGRFIKVTPLRRIGTGMVLAGLTFLIPAWIESRIQAGQTPHVGWQIAAYVPLTMAEILVSITALEFSYTQAPRKMKSFVMGVFYLSITLGNVFTSLVNDAIHRSEVARHPILQGPSYYLFFSITMLCTAAVFMLWSPFYRGQTYVQLDDPAPEPAQG